MGWTANAARLDQFREQSRPVPVLIHSHADRAPFLSRTVAAQKRLETPRQWLAGRRIAMAFRLGPKGFEKSGNDLEIGGIQGAPAEWIRTKYGQLQNFCKTSPKKGID